VVARGYDERRYQQYDDRRARESYEASSRRYDRGYRAPPVYRGFEEFASPRTREADRRVYWYEGAPRRVYRDDGWRRY
jgi:hypothetical protein